MEPTMMPPEQMGQAEGVAPYGDLSEDEVAAMLGFITTLSEQSLGAKQAQEGMMMGEQEMSGETEMPQQETTPAEGGADAKLDTILAELEELKANSITSEEFESLLKELDVEVGEKDEQDEQDTENKE